MEFLKIIYGRKCRLTKKGDGAAFLKEGNLRIKIFSKSRYITTAGLVDGGIGCETEESNCKNKSGYSTATRQLAEGDVPPNLAASGYTFVIPARKVTDSEYVFMFADAKMAGYAGKNKQKESSRCRKAQK